MHQPAQSKEEQRAVTIPILVVAERTTKTTAALVRWNDCSPTAGRAIVPGDHGNTDKSPVFGTAVLAFLKSKSQADLAVFGDADFQGEVAFGQPIGANNADGDGVGAVNGA